MSKPKFNFEGIKPAFFGGGLKAFIQTVLPTIYDDSLSYYELLNKVVKHLNNMGDAVKTLDENQELFFATVTKYINENATETYDIVLDNPFTTLSAEEVNEIYQAVEDNKIVRVIVKQPNNGNQYVCYYASYDRSTVDDNTTNDLYFMGYPIKRFDYTTRYFDMKVVKIEHDTGYVTAYSDHKIPTKAYVDNSVDITERSLVNKIDEIDAKIITFFISTNDIEGDGDLDSTKITTSDTVENLYNKIANQNNRNVSINVELRLIKNDSVSYILEGSASCRELANDRVVSIRFKPDDIEFYFLGFASSNIWLGSKTTIRGLPQVTSADNGKFLGVKYGGWNLVDAPSGNLPGGGNAGDFLVKTTTGAGWKTVPSAESEVF